MAAKPAPSDDALRCGGCQGNGNCPRCKGSGLRPLEWGEMALPEGAGQCRRCGGNGVCVGCKGCGWVLLQPAAPAAPADGLVVSPDGPCKSLAAALAAAAPGAVIRVRPGKYREAALLLDKPVQIIGDAPSREILIRCPKAIVVRAPGVCWKRLRFDAALDVVEGEATVEDCAFDSLAAACVTVSGAAGLLLKRCRLTNACGHALIVRESPHAVVEECDFHDAAQAGVLVECGGKLTLRRSKVHGGLRAGVFVEGGAQATLEECEVFGNGGPGLTVKPNAAVVLHRTRVHANGRSGLVVCPQASATITDSAVVGNRSWGVLSQPGSEVRLERTEVQEAQAAPPRSRLMQSFFAQLAPYFYDAPEPTTADAPPTAPIPDDLDLNPADPAVSRLRKREAAHLRRTDFPEELVRRLLLRGVRPTEIAAVSPRCARLVEENRPLSPHRG